MFSLKTACLFSMEMYLDLDMSDIEGKTTWAKLPLISIVVYTLSGSVDIGNMTLDLYHIPHPQYLQYTAIS